MGGWRFFIVGVVDILERDYPALAQRVSSYRSSPREYSHIIRLLQLPRISAFSPRYPRLLGKSMRARSRETPTRVCASALSLSLSLPHVSRASIVAIIAADATYVRYSTTPRSPRCVAYARARVGGTSTRACVCRVVVCTCVGRARGEVPVNDTVAFVQPSYLCWLERDGESKNERERGGGRCGR